MWEGLARTRRQDRVLHGGAKVANVIFGLIAFPLWVIGQLLGGRVRDVLVRLERLDGSTQVTRLTPASPSFVVAAPAGAMGVARTYTLLGIEHIDAQQATETLHILLKYQTDIAKAAKELSATK